MKHFQFFGTQIGTHMHNSERPHRERQRKKSRRTGFEPARGDPNGLHGPEAFKSIALTTRPSTLTHAGLRHLADYITSRNVETGLRACETRIASVNLCV